MKTSQLGAGSIYHGWALLGSVGQKQGGKIDIPDKIRNVYDLTIVFEGKYISIFEG